MTVTRLWQAGAELQHIGELEDNQSIGSNITMVVSNTKAKTGSWSFRCSTGNTPRGRGFASTTQVRAGVFVNHNSYSANTSTRAVIWYVPYSGGAIIVQINGNTNNVELVVGGVTQATVAWASSGMATTDTWYHMGLTVKANASTGLVSFYVDGVQKLTYSGNTGSGITGVYFSGANNVSSSLGWNNAAYWDDFYVDDTVGEADAAPPSPRFPFLLVNGSGNYTNWTPNTGTNSGAVDDSGAPNDETDYVYATASGVKDSYALTNTSAGVTVPAGYSIEAVIPVAWARKTDAGTASTLKLGTRLSSTDLVGSAQTLTTAYGPVWERQTAKPGGGAWSEANVDSAEFYAESAGSY